MKDKESVGQAPPEPQCGFGKEESAADIRARIAWERWAAKRMRAEGHSAYADGHDLARVAYEELLRRKGYAP